MNPRRLCRICGRDSLPSLRVSAPERSSHREERGCALERLRERGRNEHRPRVGEPRGFRRVRIPRNGSNLVASLEQASCDGASLFSGSSDNDHCQSLAFCHAPLPRGDIAIANCPAVRFVGGRSSPRGALAPHLVAQAGIPVLSRMVKLAVAASRIRSRRSFVLVKAENSC